MEFENEEQFNASWVSESWKDSITIAGGRISPQWNENLSKETYPGRGGGTSSKRRGKRKKQAAFQIDCGEKKRDRHPKTYLSLFSHLYL
jgi:hypothetical protein